MRRRRRKGETGAKRRRRRGETGVRRRRRKGETGTQNSRRRKETEQAVNRRRIFPLKIFRPKTGIYWISCRRMEKSRLWMAVWMRK